MIYLIYSEDLVSESGEGLDIGEVGSEVGTESQQEHSDQGGAVDSTMKTAGGPPSETPLPSLEPVRIIHKDQDSINAFCINKANDGLMAAATMREVQELDISLLLNNPGWLTNECELDVLALNKDPEEIHSSNFLIVQTPLDKTLLESTRGHDPELTSGSTLNLSNMGHGSPLMGQTGRGSSVVRK